MSRPGERVRAQPSAGSRCCGPSPKNSAPCIPTRSYFLCLRLHSSPGRPLTLAPPTLAAASDAAAAACPAPPSPSLLPLPCPLLPLPLPLPLFSSSSPPVSHQPFLFSHARSCPAAIRLSATPLLPPPETPVVAVAPLSSSSSYRSCTSRP